MVRTGMAAAAVAMAAVAGIAAGGGTAAAASEWDNWFCSGGSWDASRGVGDRDVQAICRPKNENGGNISATFMGYGEHLILSDDRDGDEYAVAYVTVDGETVGYTADHNGPTDINLDYPEGLGSSVEICTNDGAYGAEQVCRLERRGRT